MPDDITIKVLGFPERDDAMVEKVVNHAIAAENWYQTTWVLVLDDAMRNDPANELLIPSRIREMPCSTAMCVAGFTVLEFSEWQLYKPGQHVVAHPETDEIDHIGAVAARLLGLSPHEAACLFYSQHTAESLVRVKDEILEGVHRECSAASLSGLGIYMRCRGMLSS